MEKIILDCDPGHDDAIALLLACRNENIQLLGVTVSSGNQSIEKTSYNALSLCQYLNIDVPVCIGANHPLIKDVEVCAEIHGESGLDGFKYQKLTRSFDKRHAVSFIIETILKEKEPVTLVVTGPMTNIALCLRMEPKIKNNIKRIVVMGGSYQMGNVTPASEFNIYCDPEAAHIVLSSGLPIYMITLDVTRKVLCYNDIILKMAQYQNKASELFKDLMLVYNENQKKVFAHEGGPLHDPVTIAYLINENLVTFSHVNVKIDISHSNSYGRTNCDMFNYLKQPPNCYVSKDIDVNLFWGIIEESIKNYK